MSSEARRGARTVRERCHAQECTLSQRFTELYEEHFDSVWRFARYLGGPDTSVDDAVQDVFLVAYRRFQDFEAGSSPRSWLFAITFRVMRDHLRSRRRRTRLLERVSRMMFAQPAATPFDHAAHAESGRALWGALDGLSEEQRATLLLADIEELSGPEIAAMLNVKLNTVYSRLHSARRVVSRRLQEEP